jgi:hypothetical protein
MRGVVRARAPSGMNLGTQSQCASPDDSSRPQFALFESEETHAGAISQHNPCERAEGRSFFQKRIIPILLEILFEDFPLSNLRGH